MPAAGENKIISTESAQHDLPAQPVISGNLLGAGLGDGLALERREAVVSSCC